MADTNTRQGKRTPVTLKIKFKSETLEQFIERYAVDVSQGGIFIRTKEPLAVGTQMKFEFQLRDASPLIAGEGTVVWTRENDPSRPAIAPGMGVRFDRLADGSQTVLEKILAEKAKQAPSRSGSTTAPGDSQKAAMFTDTPTRVAPAPVQEALGVKSGRNRHDSEQTPLPKPMPFHSDAEDFDERAFEEATKVRSLEELAAQAGLDTGDLTDDTKTATKIMPPDELAVRRHAGRSDATIADPPLASPPDRADTQSIADRAAAHSMPDRDSAPGLPSPPAAPRAYEHTPPRAEPIVGGAVPAPKPAPPRASHPSMQPANVSSPGIVAPGADASQRTVLGVGASATASSASPRASASEAVPQALGPEPTRPVAPSRPSSAPIIIGILLVVAAAMGAVYWFVLRDPGAKETVAEEKPTGDGSAVVTTPGSGSAVGSGSDAAGSDTGSGSAVAMTGSGEGSGSAGAMTGSGAGSGSAAVPAVAATVDTVIASAAKGATVEIIGTAQKGPAPFTAKLEKGKAYKARISAAGFTVSEIDVKGGVRTTAKLVMKPRVVTVTTDPPGASIYIDGIDTGKLTPTEVTLTASQAGRPRIRMSMRRAGFRPTDQVIEASTFTDSGGTMTWTVEAKLSPTIARPPGGGSGGAGGSGGTGTNPTGTGTGSGSAATGTGSAGTGTTGTGTTGTTGTGTTGTGTTGTGTTGTGTGSGSATAPKPPGSSLDNPRPSGSGALPTELK